MQCHFPSHSSCDTQVGSAVCINTTGNQYHKQCYQYQQNYKFFFPCERMVTSLNINCLTKWNTTFSHFLHPPEPERFPISMLLQRPSNATLTSLANTHSIMGRHLLIEEGLQCLRAALGMKVMPSIELGGAQGAYTGHTLTHHGQPLNTQHHVEL